MGVEVEGGKLVAIREGQRVGMALGFLQRYSPGLSRGRSMETYGTLSSCFLPNPFSILPNGTVSRRNLQRPLTSGTGLGGKAWQ